MHRALLFLLPLGLTACDAAHESSQALANAAKTNYYAERAIWEDVFTYHPPKPIQEPQTRYCYKMQSDVVCYDSVQPTQTARLNGYQDGDQISFVQPGGGSLGASGGGAQAPRMRSGVQTMPTSSSVADYTMEPGSITVRDTPKVVVAPFNAPMNGSHAKIVANPSIKGAGAPVTTAESMPPAALPVAATN